MTTTPKTLAELGIAELPLTRLSRRISELGNEAVKNFPQDHRQLAEEALEIIKRQLDDGGRLALYTFISLLPDAKGA